MICGKPGANSRGGPTRDDGSDGSRDQQEVLQPLAAIVASAHAGLRWLGGIPPELGVVRDTLKTSSKMVIGRARCCKGCGQCTPAAMRQERCSMLMIS